MSTERNDGKADTPEAVVERAVAAPVSRRMLIRGAAAAVPTILTLNSPVAVAQARSSNVLSLNYDAEPDVLGDKLCVDLVDPPVPQKIEDNRYDLGDPPTAKVTRIPLTDEYGARVYRSSKNSSSNFIVHPADMCKNGGDYYYEVPTGTGNQTEWKTLTVRKGMMASGTALSSFTSGVTVYKNV